MTPNSLLAVEKTVQQLFKKDGKPFPLTAGQAEIFRAATDPQYKNVWISAPTRYGKSEVLALALVFLASSMGLKIPIVAGSEDKAKKIMEYIILHLTDHPSLYEKLINLDVSVLEKLKVKKSQDTLRWADGGWIFVTSIDSRSISKEGEKVVGEGGDVVVLEEAGLIRSIEQFSKVVRMTEGKLFNKLILNGNCVERSVHQRAFNDPKYYKVRITLDQAIAEKRFTQEEVDRKKEDTTSKDWKRYYLVEFPGENEFTYFKPQKYEVLPDDLVYYGAIDPALGNTLKESKRQTESKGSKIGVVVIGVDKDGQKYEVDSFGEHIKPDEAIRKIFNMPYQFKRFGLEDVQFQRYFLDITKRRARQLGKNIPFEGIKTKGNKIERIEALEPIISTGEILFKGDNQLWEDMQSYPQTEFLDVLDALEMANKISDSKPVSIAFGDETW